MRHTDTSIAHANDDPATITKWPGKYEGAYFGRGAILPVRRSVAYRSGKLGPVVLDERFVVEVYRVGTNLLDKPCPVPELPFGQFSAFPNADVSAASTSDSAR